MILRRAISSTLQFFSVFVLFSLGFAFAALPFLEEARIHFVDILLNEPDVFSYVGAAFFFTSLLLFFGFYGLNRGRYLRIKMGDDLAEIRVRVIRQSLEECFKTQFSSKIFLEDITHISKNKIEIAIRIEQLEDEARERLFAQTERELQNVLKERFGYSGAFYLTVRSL